MLFSGSKPTKSKGEEKKEKRVERDAKYEVQEATFLRWANTLLGTQMRDATDLADPKFALPMVKILNGAFIQLSGNRYEDWNKVVEELGEPKLASAGLSEVSEGQQKPVLNIWFGFMQLFWRRFSPVEVCEEKLSEAMRNWCTDAAAKSKHQIQISDFTSSWRDGYAFNVMIAAIDETLVDFSVVDEMRAEQRMEYAFEKAATAFGMPRIIEPKDMFKETLDTKSVVCWLMTLYLRTVGKQSFKWSSASLPARLLKTDQLEMSGGTNIGSDPSTSQYSSTEKHSPPPLARQHAGSPDKARRLSAVGSSTPQKQHSQEGILVEAPEVRSRQSSSSSQKSGRSRKARKEELMREYELATDLSHV